MKRHKEKGMIASRCLEELSKMQTSQGVLIVNLNTGIVVVIAIQLYVIMVKVMSLVQDVVLKGE